MSRKNLLTIFILFLFHSCTIPLSLDALVSEHIVFKKGKSIQDSLSGTYSFSLDLTGSHGLLSLLKKLEGNAEDVDALLYNAFHEAGGAISEVPGVTKVNFKHDSSFLHFTISFEFNSLQALNEALACIKKNKKDHHVASITLNKGRLVREFSVVESLLQHPAGMDEEKCTRFELFFKKIKWQTTYIFEGLKIRQPTYGYKELARDKHGIVFEHFLLDIRRGCRHVVYLR